jgi:hypothetical protein
MVFFYTFQTLMDGLISAAVVIDTYYRILP